jgi:hypothetical protein
MLAALAATRSFFDGSPRQGDMLAVGEHGAESVSCIMYY